MKSILSAWLWFVGILYLVFFVFLLIIVSYVLPKQKYDPFFKALARFIFRLLFIQVEVKGTENFDPQKSYVIMGNHVSMFDIPLLFGYVPVSFVGIEAAEHFKTPLYGWALRRYGNIPINRKSSRASLQSILKGAETVKHGTSVVILPEGTRGLKPSMGNFKSFPFVLAQKAGHEILPFAFSGLWKVNNKTSWHIRPGKIQITFGKAIEAEQVKNMELNELNKMVKGKIAEMITAP